MSLVELQKIDSANFIVYATSYLNPLSDMCEASREIACVVDRPCDLLFDLLLANGDSFNRYVICKFDGKDILRDSINVIEENQIDETLMSKIREYYRGINKSRYINSALSKHEIGKIIRNY